MFSYRKTEWEQSIVCNCYTHKNDKSSLLKWYSLAKCLPEQTASFCSSLERVLNWFLILCSFQRTHFPWLLLSWPAGPCSRQKMEGPVHQPVLSLWSSGWFYIRRPRRKKINNATRYNISIECWIYISVMVHSIILSMSRKKKLVDSIPTVLCHANRYTTTFQTGSPNTTDFQTNTYHQLVELELCVYHGKACVSSVSFKL